MLYVYAIVDRPEGGGRAGLRGAPTEIYGSNGPFAVASRHDEFPQGPSEDDLWAHESVVEGLMEAATVLPMRFGSEVAGEEELEAVLDRRRPEFEELIESVRGAVELSVRAQVAPRGGDAEPPPADPPRPSGPGTAYLLERAARDRRGAELIERVHRPLADLARRSALRAAQAGGPRVFKSAYLVDHDRVESFASRLRELEAALGGDAEILCTGPWPPYSFSSVEGL